MPALEGDSKFNSAKRNIVFDCYVRLESYTNASLNWYRTKGKLGYPDRPELTAFYIRTFEIVTEFVNGPCPENQRMLYRYRTDVYMGIIMREIDDVNNLFYSLKNAVIDWIFGLIEGEGSFPLSEKLKETSPKLYLCTGYMSSNITPSAVMKLIYHLLKRLAIYRKMIKNKSFKNKIW